MSLTPQEMVREVAATGFGAEPLEKVFRLMALLDALNSHPFLKTRIALKGGTALNLFHFDVPRLSVDIDLNYIGAADRETMLADRSQVEQAVQAVCSREALAIKRMPPDHAGGKWRLTYVGAKGAPGNLELDINFMLRTPRPDGAVFSQPGEDQAGSGAS
jgi:predicted nucleotidyltransferase component of viral defense system